MRLCLTSDLHGHLPKTPPCDVLVIAGDVTPLGMENHIPRQMRWLRGPFETWLRERDAKHVVGVAGNHDFALERNDWLGHELSWIYLRDSEVYLAGVKFYGIPWIPKLKSWAFYGTPTRLKSAFDRVPQDTDVVVSHGPPYRMCDMTAGRDFAGSGQARDMIDRVFPKIFVCGHIHEGYGHYPRKSKTDVYNVAHVDVFYRPVNDPVVIEI